MMTTIGHVAKTGWDMSDEDRIWPNSRDFAPSCRKCLGGHVTTLRLGYAPSCDECQGTGADSMPWSELFRNARLV